MIAYLGSMMHFMRSLYQGHLQQDGFIIEHEIQVPNIEKERVKSVYVPNVTQTDSIPIDTLHHYWEVLREPDYYVQKVKSYDNLVTVNPDQTRKFISPATSPSYTATATSGSPIRNHPWN